MRFFKNAAAPDPQHIHPRLFCQNQQIGEFLIRLGGGEGCRRHPVGALAQNRCPVDHQTETGKRFVFVIDLAAVAVLDLQTGFVIGRSRFIGPFLDQHRTDAEGLGFFAQLQCVQRLFSVTVGIPQPGIGQVDAGIKHRLFAEPAVVIHRVPLRIPDLQLQQSAGFIAFQLRPDHDLRQIPPEIFGIDIDVFHRKAIGAVQIDIPPDAAGHKPRHPVPSIGTLYPAGMQPFTGKCAGASLFVLHFPDRRAKHHSKGILSRA